jgi:hypothetical protein
MKAIVRVALVAATFAATAFQAPAALAQDGQVRLDAPFGVMVNADGSLSYFQKSATLEGFSQPIDELKFRWLQDNLGRSLAKTLCKLNVVPKSVGVSLGVVSVDWDMSVLCRMNGGWN